MKSLPPNTEPQVLLVDYNEDDLLIFNRALQKRHLPCRFHRVVDPRAALDYLAALEHRPAPHLLITTLQLTGPSPSGLELLAWVRQHPRLKDLPVVVLTDSVDPHDRERALALGADRFLEKSPDLTELLQTVSEFLPGTLSAVA